MAAGRTPLEDSGSMSVTEQVQRKNEPHDPSRDSAAGLQMLEAAIGTAAGARLLDQLAAVLSGKAREIAGGASVTVVAYGARPVEARDGVVLTGPGPAGGRNAGTWVAGAPAGSAEPPVARMVQRLPLVDDGRVVGRMTVEYPEGRSDPSEERLALVRALAAAAGTLIGRLRDRLERPPAGMDEEAVRPSDAARAERARIARELHDGLIQALYGMGLLIRTQAERTDLPERGRQTMQGWVRRIDGLVDEASAYVAGLEVRGDALIDLGAGIDAIAEEAAAAGLDVSTEVNSTDDGRLSRQVGHELLVVAREAASNAIRHARARRLAIHVEVDPLVDTVTLTVDDDGVGFEPARHRPGGHGLDNMAARAAALRGSLDVLSRRSAGTRVRLRAPMRHPGSLEGDNHD
jgi:signal transduction histidine kinase